MSKTTDIENNSDHETRISEDDHRALRLWLRILTCSNLVESDLRGLLRTEFKTTLPRFDLLAQLERVPEGLTMGELSKRMMVSGGNISGITSQLVDEGLVTRKPVPNNRRTFIVKLTTKGDRYFKKLSDKHENWVIKMFSHLTETEMQTMMDILRKLKDSINQNRPE